MRGALVAFEKGELFSLGVGKERQISCFYKKDIQRKTQVYWKNEWGTEIVMAHACSNLAQKRCRLCDSHQDS